MNEVAEKIPSIYQYILEEETNFRTARVPLASNWRDWNFFDHIDRSFTLLNSRFYKGPQDYTRPFNQIILPIRNVNVRVEGFDVKDVQIYVDNAENYHKSFVARKKHDRWAKDNGIDTAIDESVESYFDYGLALLKNVNEVRPEVVQLQQIAFCDQTNIMAGPICLKHNYSIGELLEFKGKWKATEIDKTILMARFTQDAQGATGDVTKTPSKYVEVYELHGMFPESWLGSEKLGEEWEDTGKYSPQIHIVTYYISPTDKSKVGVTLFKGKEPKPIFKALLRDPIFGRTCGRGGIEELFHPQIWANNDTFHLQQMLEATAKILLKTNKKKIASLNNFSNMKQGQIIDLDGDGTLDQLVLQPINKTHFDNAVNKWEQVARTIGAASDPALGLNPVSGTPLGTTEIVTSQGQGIHEYRRGKIAVFWAGVYRDWVLPHLSAELQKSNKWLDDLTLDELQDIAEKTAIKEANGRIKRMVLSGKILTQGEADQFRESVKEEFMKGGEKRFIEIIKDEFANLALDVEINIVGKQKNMVEIVSKLNSVFRTLFTPGAIQALQASPELANLLNQVLEAGGMNQINFGKAPPQPIQQQPQLQPRELTSA
ncbi:MAG: hypothetical protein AAB706_01520 [Patescibacteria group bacterium]|mgnify:CR=1 FL=1